MNNSFFRKCVLLGVSALLSFCVSAQQGDNYSPIKSHLFKDSTHTSAMYEDPLLVNGRIYRQYKPGAENDPYLFSPEWHPATIFIKDHMFTNRKVKYDLYQNELVLMIKNATANYNKICLNESFVDSFIMDANRLFVHKKTLNAPDIKANYVEIIVNDEISMIRQYQKAFIEIYNNFSPQGKYGDTTTKEYLITNGQLIHVSNRRMFLKFFENDKSDIRQFMRKNKIKYRKATKIELIELMNYCNALVKAN